MVEIRIIGGEPQRQARQDAGWQLLRINTPLLACVAGKKCVVQLAPDQTQTLFFERLRIGNAGVGAGVHKGFCFARIHLCSKKSIDETQIHRHLIRLVAHHCPHAMAVRLKLTEALHIVPHLFVLGMKDMWAIHVHHYPGLVAAGVAVAGHVVA